MKKKFQHVADSSCIVTAQPVKDFLNNPQWKIRFSNGETSTLSQKRFTELFVEVPND